VNRYYKSVSLKWILPVRHLLNKKKLVLSELELAQSRQQIMTLETNLNKSTSEVQELRSMIKENEDKFMGISNTAGLRLQLSHLQKDLVRMKETLFDREEQIVKIISILYIS